MDANGSGAENMDERPRGCFRRLRDWIVALIAVLGIGIITLWNYYQDHRNYTILVPLYADATEYLEFIANPDGFTMEGDYSKKVSRDIVKTITETKSDWLDEFVDARERSAVDDRIEFKFFPEGFDRESYEVALQTAMDHAKGEVVLAIGHVTSTVTRLYGPLYAEHDIPLIAAMATASELPHQLRTEDGIGAVLRLPPANEHQVRAISDFLLQRGAGDGLRPGVLITRDLSNPTYSNDLVEKFRGPFVREPFKHAEKEKENLDQVMEGKILAVMPIGGENSEPIIDPNLQRLAPYAVLFFGMTEPSLEALVQLRAANVSSRYTIFTDGAVDEYLRPRIRSLINNTEGSNDSPSDATLPADTIYISFPLVNSVPEQIRQIFPNDSETQQRLEMTHAVYIADAAQIALSIIWKDISRTGYRIPVVPWREAKDLATRRMNSWVDGKIPRAEVDYIYTETTYTITGGDSTVQTVRWQPQYRFDEFGNGSGFNYRLFFSVGPDYGGWHPYDYPEAEASAGSED